MSGREVIPAVESRWFRLGLVIAFLQVTFLAALLVLLRVDQTVGLAFAVVGGTLGSLALVVYIQFRFRDRS